MIRLLHHQIIASASLTERSLKFQLPELPTASLYLAFIATSGGRAPGLTWGEHWSPVAEFPSESTHTFVGLYQSQTGLSPEWSTSKAVSSIAGCLQVFDGAEISELRYNTRSGVFTPPLPKAGPSCHFWFQDWAGNTIMEPVNGFNNPLSYEFFGVKSSNDTTLAHSYIPHLEADVAVFANGYPGNSLGGSIAVALGDVVAPAPSVDLKALAAQMREWADKLEAAQ